MNNADIRAKFAQLDREQFADWLWRGLRMFYSGAAARRHAFDPCSAFILQQDSIVEGLARVYEEYVPEENQLMFRQALGDVLRNQANVPEAPMPAFQNIIYLMARIKAVESLDALVPTVGTGYLGRRAPEFLYETMAALRYLAPSQQAYNAVCEMISSPNFDDGYLFDAMKVLIECQPSQTAKTLLELIPRLTHLREQAMELGGEEVEACKEATRGWVEHIARYAPLTQIKSFYEDASHAPSEVWLFKALFDPEYSPIRLIQEDESSDPVLVSPGGRLPIALPQHAYWTTRAILRRADIAELSSWINDPDESVAGIFLHGVTNRKENLADALKRKFVYLMPRSQPVLMAMAR